MHQKVEDQFSLLTIIEQPFRRQRSQMLRNGRNRLAEHLRNVAYAAFVDAENMQDGLTRRMAKRFAAMRPLPQILLGGKLLFQRRYLFFVKANNRTALEPASLRHASGYDVFHNDVMMP